MEIPDSGLTDEARRTITSLDSIDILIGIPSFENAETVGEVVEKVARGVDQHFPEYRALVMVSDGESEEGTREAAKEANIPDSVERLVTIYRGLPGKGSAFRAVFEAGAMLEVEACLVVDADLRTELDRWVKLHLTPILIDGMDLLAPSYARHKFDGTITNNVCFPLTSALYGKKVRQPIGGDFSLSGELVEFYANQNEWGTDVARFGIDIWMTTTAINEGFTVGQTNLGAKIHDPKDPGESLGPMFKEVVGTLFRLMERYDDNWSRVQMISDIPVFGPPFEVEPEPVPVDREGLRRRAFKGWKNHAADYEEYLSRESYLNLQESFSGDGDTGVGLISAGEWARILFDYSVAYNFVTNEPDQMIRTLIPLYFARTACLFDEMEGMTDREAENHIQSLVNVVLEEKPYLRQVWPVELL